MIGILGRSNTAVKNTSVYCLTLNFLRRVLLSWKSSFQPDWWSWISDSEGRAFLSFSLSFPPWSSLNMASVSSFSFSVRSGATEAEERVDEERRTSGA